MSGLGEGANGQGATSARVGIGHNGGPTIEGGTSWRRHCWKAAREALLPTLPIEVLRNRVRRAGELGLDYRTYASVRAATGHDVVAFLFSSNALRALPARGVPLAAVPADRSARLEAIRACGRIGLATRPLSPEALQAAMPVLDAAHPAPAAFAPFAGTREALHAALRGPSGMLPPDRVILVGDMDLERDWTAAGRLAWYLPAERYFG